MKVGASWFKIGGFLSQDRGLLESSHGVSLFKIRGLLGSGIITFSLETPRPT